MIIVRTFQSRFGMIVVASLLSLSGSAEEFTLFDEGRGVEKEPKREVIQVVTKPQRKNIAIKNQKNFRLRGTSRMGSRYTAILEDSKGKEHRIQWVKGEEPEIPENRGYRLMQVSPRSVLLHYPDDNRCQGDLPEYGMKCLQKGAVAKVTLLRKRAIAGPKPTQKNKSKQVSKQKRLGKSKEANNKKKAKSSDPFKALLEQKRKKMTPQEVSRAAEQKKKYQASKKMYQKTKKRTIPDDQVPAGKRVVKTPFGDVLVDIK